MSAMLQMNSSGPDVTALQQALQAAGLVRARSTVPSELAPKLPCSRFNGAKG